MTKITPWPYNRLALIGAKKSVTEILLEEKGKWTNKGNDKQEEAHSHF